MQQSHADSSSSTNSSSTEEPNVDPCEAYTKCSNCGGTNFNLHYLDQAEIGFDPCYISTPILKLCCTKCYQDHGHSCSKCNKSCCEHTHSLGITKKRSWKCANCSGINDYRCDKCERCNSDNQELIKNPYVVNCEVCNTAFHMKDRGLSMYKCRRCNKKCTLCGTINNSFAKECKQCGTFLDK